MQTFEPMTMEDQVNTGILYKLTMQFSVDISLTEMNEFMEHMGMREHLQAENGAHITMTQTTPFIPDTDTINKYKTIIACEINKGHSAITIEQIRFDGFTNIEPLKRTNQTKLKEAIIEDGITSILDFCGYPPNIDHITEHVIELIDKKLDTMSEDELEGYYALYDII